MLLSNDTLHSNIYNSGDSMIRPGILLQAKDRADCFVGIVSTTNYILPGYKVIFLNFIPETNQFEIIRGSMFEDELSSYTDKCVGYIEPYNLNYLYTKEDISKADRLLIDKNCVWFNTLWILSEDDLTNNFIKKAVMAYCEEVRKDNSWEYKLP